MNTNQEIGTAGEGASVPANIESVLPFQALLTATGAASEEELVEAIESDGCALMDLKIPVSLQRYADAIDLKEHPRAREAAVAACARSLERFEGFSSSMAETAAREEADAAEHRPRPERSTGRVAPRRNLHRRAGKQFGIWTPVQLVLMFVFGAGMAVATLYWMGIVNSARVLQVKEQNLRLMAEDLAEQEEELRVRAEAITAAKNKMSTEAVALIEDVLAKTKMFADGEHLAEGFEILVALEDVVAVTSRHDQGLAERFSRQRIDETVMPALRLLYPDSEEMLSQIGQLLAAEEEAWLEAVREEAAKRGVQY
jgi:hypothetical protein